MLIFPVLVVFHKCGHSADTEMLLYSNINHILAKYQMASLWQKSRMYWPRGRTVPGSLRSISGSTFRGLRLRVPSGIWIDRKRWGKKNDINIPNIPGEERNALLSKRAKLKELVDVIEHTIEATDDKSTVTREWLEKLIRRTLRPKATNPVEEKKRDFFSLTEEYLAAHKLSESRVKHFKVLVRTLKRYELYRRLSSRRFVLDVHTVMPMTLDDFGSFLMKEPEIFDEHPELYDEVPYARPKVRKNLPMKRAPYLNAAGELVIPGRPKERGMNYVSDMLIRLRSFYVWLNDSGFTTNDPFKQYKIAEIVYGTPVYITTEERKQLAEADMARRTFIGNVYKSVKDPAIVGAMSGHKDGSRAFARYRDIDMDIKREAVSVLE